jgi:hypothetical protein
MERPRRVGMAWYRPEDYDRLRATLADGAKLPASYDAWRISAEQVEATVSQSGVAVLRVQVEPEAFATWCEQHGLATDGAARARYANEAAEQLGDAGS